MRSRMQVFEFLTRTPFRQNCVVVALILMSSCLTDLSIASADEPQKAPHVSRPANQRFETANIDEVPDFRRHVLPLLGRLGCNGRACHGSFQGQGGFRLSLFGYDYQADHRALLESEEPRVNLKSPDESLILYKPTHGDEHGGGERMKVDSWPYHLLQRWIEAGAQGVKEHDPELVRLTITPDELLFSKIGESEYLQVLATWSDGSVEDVTPLCRYQTNDDSIASVDTEGHVTSKGQGDTHIIAFYDNGVAVSQVIQPVSSLIGSRYPTVSAPTRVDELIVNKLRKLGIVPSENCSDSEFLRRVSLDLTGTLPTPEEIKSFLEDTSSDKRTTKIEELLERPTYVARWTTKLCEITGNSPRHFQDQAPPEEYARHWYEWIARRVRENVPYDELVEGIVLGRSREPGESYQAFAEEESAYYRGESPADFTDRKTMPYFWARHNLRLPEERALNFSYAFLGVRIECAQCHKHPFDQWTQQDFQSFTALFNRIGYGIPPDDRKTYQAMIDQLGDKGNQGQRVQARLKRAQKGQVVPWLEVFLSEPGTLVEKKGRVVEVPSPVAPRVLGGDEFSLDPGEDPRRALMDWMRRSDNPYFSRVFVNRVWAEYFGVGIIHPPDDMNLANPPSNAALLDYLSQGFIEHGFDMKWLHREITNSQTYQRSLKSNETNRFDERNFSRSTARRLRAEVLFDAIAQATANSSELARATTDLEERAIGPRGGALAGRYRFDNYASTVFGRSPREENCDCSASNEPNLLQAIYLQNDKDVVEALNRKNGWLYEISSQRTKNRIDGKSHEVDVLIDEAFLRTLSRPAKPEEIERAKTHFTEVGDPVEGLRELLWALLNTREFVTNH